MSIKFRYLGITDECIVCQLCGKADLKSTVVLAVLDEDGNEETVTYYGSTCAARALAVKGGSRAVLDSARAAHTRTVDAAQDARSRLAFYGLPTTGTPPLRDLREPLWKFVDANPRAARATADENRALLLQCLAGWQSAIADAELLTR